jgi:transposase-like protein
VEQYEPAGHATQAVAPVPGESVGKADPPEIKKLKAERDILKKAAAYFAKEST